MNVIQDALTTPMVIFVSISIGCIHLHMEVVKKMINPNFLPEMIHLYILQNKRKPKVCTYSAVANWYNTNYNHIHTVDSEDYVQLRKTQNLLKEINENVTQHAHQLVPYFQHINSLLTNVLLKCKLAVSEQTCPDIADFSNKQKIPPGKCNEHQPRFKKTTKTPGRKKNCSILR